MKRETLKWWDHHLLALVLLLWAGSILWIHPGDDFPLNDDWAYAQAVQRLLATGQYDPGDWPAMTLWLHIIWGAGFTSVFGFSFLTLRMSTILLATIGIGLSYLLSWEITRNQWWSAICAFCLAFNPLFYSLSLTYMTDVPFLVLNLAAVYFYRRAFLARSLQYWIVATLFAVGSILIRQLGLILPIAFGIAAMIDKRNLRTTGTAIFSIGLSFFVLQFFNHWLAKNPGLPKNYGSFSIFIEQLAPDALFFAVNNYPGSFLFYAAVTICPLLIINTYRPIGDWKAIISISLATLMSVGFAYWYWEKVPVFNLWYDMGLGPVTLSSTFRGYWGAWEGKSWIWEGIRILGFGGGLFFLFLLIRRGLDRITSRQNWTATQSWKLGILLFLCAYHLFLFLNPLRFDRYFLQVQPLWMLLLLPTQGAPLLPRWKVSLAVVVALPMVLFSVLGTNDYFAWNRVRWQAARDLQFAKGISPTQIDGGFEYNGWYQTGPRNTMGTNSKSWYFVAEDEYVIDFNHYDDCYQILEKREVPTLFPGKGSILTLHRKPYQFFDTLQLKGGIIEGIYQENRIGLAALGTLDPTAIRKDNQTYWLSPEAPYGPTIRIFAPAPCAQITYSFWASGEKTLPRIVLSSTNSQDFFREAKSFTEKEADGWRKIRAEIRLPSDLLLDTLLVYPWLPNEEEIHLDEIELIIRQ